MSQDAQAMLATPGPDLVYREALDAGNFQIQQCGGCDQHIFFPRMVCPKCGSNELAWVKPSGLGAVYSTTVVRRKPERGGDINVAIIELDEGPRMMSRVEGIAPTEVKIGMRVSVKLIDQNDTKLVVFEAAEGGAA